jgi:hypothetical protein
MVPVPNDEGLVANPVTPVSARPHPRRRRLREISHVVLSLTAMLRASTVRARLTLANDIGRRKAASNHTSGIKEGPL